MKGQNLKKKTLKYYWELFKNRVMRKPYKTKKKKLEFKNAYMKIGDLNKTISIFEVERDFFIKAEKWDEAIDREKMIHDCRIELLEMGKLGWDIEYTSPQVSGYETRLEYPELKSN